VAPACYAWAVIGHVVIVTALACVAAGCATTTRGIEQRTTQGPTAEQVWTSRVFLQTGREPTFEERRQWDTQLEARISDYLRAHPAAASSLDVSTFRFLRQAAVGMEKEQVRILLGAPDAITTDAAAMEALARKFWPAIKEGVTEAWTYPPGWHLYFDDSRLIDITQYVAESAK
jgi:hypothetical protein